MSPRSSPRSSAPYAVRRVRADEWRALRDLRLEALRDPLAHLAFLDRIEDALERPDDFWRDRTAAGATSTGVAQFVAVAVDDDVEFGGREELAGTVTALVTPPGEPDYLGETGPALRAALVGVYVRPRHRGSGVIRRLVAATETWLWDRGVRRVRLHVHVDNLRAQGAYRRCGYAATGARVELEAGVELEMAHELTERPGPPTGAPAP